MLVGGGELCLYGVRQHQQHQYAPGYSRFDAMASYEINKHISVQLNIQNLTDKFYFDKVSSPHYAGVGQAAAQR
jgi:outer membrane receptor for monomeric catechols